MTRLLLCAVLAFVWVHPAAAWVDGELSIWMDADRVPAMQEAGRKFEHDYGIKVNVDATENIPNNFPLAAQSDKGPDIVIFAHDKVGEWADGGLIAPVPIAASYRSRFDSKAWEAVQHRGEYWGYPLCFEVVGLIYNKKLVQDPPAQLSDLIEFNTRLKADHPDVKTILWDYDSPYYSWGIFASAGAYVYAKTADGYDTKDIGIASPGAIDALNQLIGLVRAGVLPRAASVAGMPKQMMAEGKLAMMISGPWDWSDLMKSGIDFGVAPIPGVDGGPGRAFVGVSVAYINRSSPNLDIARQFLENYAITDEQLAAANRLKPIGIPALNSLYETMSKNEDLLRQMKLCADDGEVMPNILQMGRFWGAMGSALQIATNGQATAKSALTEARENMLPARK
ncbi:MAG TPA: maltose/maltodextrin ABC transporter substrate-binding protein MalE [Chthoniobacterales bacterium]|nr:maltose/maltodextrin ABC transporter substrate-binding protein MalE [Chthoniobacterales bacterium]